jgi:arylformamidase
MEKITIEQLIRPARLADLRGLGRTAKIGSRELENAGIGSGSAGCAVVLWTDHDRFLNDPDYFWRRPQITEDGAEFLASQKTAIVAADFPGLGAPGNDRYIVKRILHRGGAFTVEQLRNLSLVAGEKWHLFCGALPIRGLAGSIIRACALINWRATKLIDLTQEHFIGMPAIGPQPTYWLRASHDATSYGYDGELSYQAHSLFMSEHAGTHFDVPYHFKESGRSIDQFDVNELLVPARFFDMSHKKPLEAITAEDLESARNKHGYSIGSGDGVVIHTGHAENYHTRNDFGRNRQFISSDGAAWLAKHKPAMVVTDLVGLDEPGDPNMPVHNQLLHGDVCMLQVTKDLKELGQGDWQVACFPINLVGGTAAPVRAFAARM